MRLSNKLGITLRPRHSHVSSSSASEGLVPRLTGDLRFIDCSLLAAAWHQLSHQRQLYTPIHIKVYSNIFVVTFCSYVRTYVHTHTHTHTQGDSDVIACSINDQGSASIHDRWNIPKTHDIVTDSNQVR